MERVASLESAKALAKTASQVEPLTACIYQVGAKTFAVAYEGECVAHGLLVGQYKNGVPAAPVQG